MIPNEILKYHNIKKFVPLLKFNGEYLLSVFKKGDKFYAIYILNSKYIKKEFNYQLALVKKDNIINFLTDKITLNDFIRKENNFTTFFQKEMAIKNQGLGYYNNDGNILYSKIWINELEDEDLLKKIKQL